MHHYPHHIGDYRKNTGHLSNEQDLAYRRLLEMYYDTEKPIPDETQWVARRLRVDSESVEYVLEEFFTKEPDGWHSSQVDAEIAKWHGRGWVPSNPDVVQLRPPIDEWKQTRLRIFARDGYVCAYCGKSGGRLECDHVIPVSRGGGSEDENLTTSCRSCNRKKSNLLPSEFARKAA